MKTTAFLGINLLKISFLFSFLFCYSCSVENQDLVISKDEPKLPSSNFSKNGLGSGQKTYTFSTAAGGKRSYYISVPANYDNTKKYKLVFFFAGTDSTGESMYDWAGLGWNNLGLEKLMENTIFVYPDQKYVWDGDKGWALGNYGEYYAGMHDIQFTKELLDLIKNTYSIDNNRIFATGHSWGGDMTNVTAYFLKGVFRAIAPVASNRPFWFEDNGNFINEPGYLGNTAVWVFFGLNDDHFGSTSPNGIFGKEQADFWILKNNGNPNQFTTKSIGNQGDVTKTYPGTSQVKLTLYQGGQYSGQGSLLGHQPPDYYFKAVTDWFKTF
ncbi:alpha/beta hydrolase family esterase [Chryseobacterium viscerum]|nr:alpha/beta hydrolase-fold protein [Chryseobacterium viscerum]